MPDYLCDCLFHGLRTLFGNTVVDINKIQYMYTTFPEVEKSQLYGKGFSLYCLFFLPLFILEIISFLR